jgi:hypothetical protein
MLMYTVQPLGVVGNGLGWRPGLGSDAVGVRGVLLVPGFLHPKAMIVTCGSWHKSGEPLL